MKSYEEKLIAYVPDFSTEEQFQMFRMRVREQISYLKFLLKESKRKEKEKLGIKRRWFGIV